MPDLKPGFIQLINRIREILASEDIPAYLVGGFLRDRLAGRDTADIDIAVGADAPETARKAAAALNGKYVLLDTANGVARVIIPGETRHLDFTTIDGDIEHDLARRDFSVNALALPLDEQFVADIDTERLIDPFGGVADLRHRILRLVNPGVFIADPVRLLRAVRIAAELGLLIEYVTETRLRRDSHLAATIAGERAREELLRLLALPGAGPRLSYLDKLGLLTALFPELEEARGVSQPRLHIWDVFTHSIQTVAAAEYLLREGGWDYSPPETLGPVPWSADLCEHFARETGAGSNRAVLLKLAALLHDIAKPGTKTTDNRGRTHFLGHPEAGAATAAAIMTRLRFSNREIQHVALLIKYHLRPTQLSQEGLPTRRAIYRFFRDAGETGIDLLFLALADHLATRGDTLDPREWRAHALMTDYVLKAHLEAEMAPPAPDKIIDGNDIMKALHVGPGPLVGRLLEAAREARAAGEINDKQDALRYLKQRLAEREKNLLEE